METWMNPPVTDYAHLLDIWEWDSLEKDYLKYKGLVRAVLETEMGDQVRQFRRFAKMYDPDELAQDLFIEDETFKYTDPRVYDLDIEGLVNEVFLRAMYKYEGQRDMPDFLTKMAKRTARWYLKKYTDKNTVYIDDAFPGSLYSEDTNEECDGRVNMGTFLAEQEKAVNYKEMKNQFQEAIEWLPIAHRRVFEWTTRGFSPEDIAEAFGTSEDEVNMLYGECMAFLKKSMCECKKCRGVCSISD